VKQSTRFQHTLIKLTYLNDFNDIFTAGFAAALMATADVYAHPQNKMASVIGLWHEFKHDADILDGLEQTEAVKKERASIPLSLDPLHQTTETPECILSFSKK